MNTIKGLKVKSQFCGQPVDQIRIKDRWEAVERMVDVQLLADIMPSFNPRYPIIFHFCGEAVRGDYYLHEVLVMNATAKLLLGRKEKKKCSECAKGEIDAPADFLIKGFRLLESGRKCPYRAYLCEGHVEVVEDADEPVTVVVSQRLEEENA